MASEKQGEYDFIVVSNRLPVDRQTSPDGTEYWQASPGGLVTALEPMMQASGGAWVGWPGRPDLEFDPFDHEGMHLVPVSLTAVEVERYYEGFCNDTIWPLYHDVIAPPSYHRVWWDAYVRVNRRFADAAARLAAKDATVWVHDYQLQLVPMMLRESRPDLTIGFFNHIPFPPYGIFSQLPWRRPIIEGLLGADVIGFQRVGDAANFSLAVRRLLGHSVRRAGAIDIEQDGKPFRRVISRAFPISIDSRAFEEVAKRPDVQARARQIREDLGNPKKILLGVDRLDYTKGIQHRLKALGELFAAGELDPEEVSFVQVASPSRERVETYRQLRDEIELTVGRINGDFGSIRHQPVSYLHHGYPRDEMVALYLAADVMLVTALRDGMNLVAKEYPAVRFDEDGVLVLSEFTGSADELRTALRVNPHDIDGLKAAILEATRMPQADRRRRMRAMRRRVLENDVARWSSSFLDVLREARGNSAARDESPVDPVVEQSGS
ncbi:alpha,alpha-trehalose-phosphate synthase (UDP-forming) [Ruicaihuangia caeni]|uniref:alpha,alpha-trehalose-phosphate synthase (UDP-forming) n=1 Tax=Ruicaihuangia caeni TaxID=3042517 RepID=UPI00338F2AEB